MFKKYTFQGALLNGPWKYYLSATLLSFIFLSFPIDMSQADLVAIYRQHHPLELNIVSKTVTCLCPTRQAHPIFSA
jgi:hypothetical protein